MLGGSQSAYTGATASYVALSAVSILSLALLCSLWIPDVSGSIALLGLFGVYIASQELLVLFMVFVPASILIDLIRGIGGPSNVSGRGWLMFLQLLEMAAKAAGGFFAYQLYRTVSSSPPSSGEQRMQAGGGYAPGYAPSYAAAPPPSVPAPGGGGGVSYQRVQDPFSEQAAAYMPPTASLGSPVSTHAGPSQQPRLQQPLQQQPLQQQPLQQQPLQQHHQHQQGPPAAAAPAAQPAPAPAAAPQFDLV